RPRLPHELRRRDEAGIVAEWFQRDRLSDVLEVFTRLEPDRAARRDADFLARSRIAPDAALAGLDLEYPEAAQLDALAALHGDPHRVEHRVDRHLGLDLGDVGDARDFVHDVDLDHCLGSPRIF